MCRGGLLARLVERASPQLGELVRAGALSRRDNGDWVLHGTPPEQLRHHKLAAALT